MEKGLEHVGIVLHKEIKMIGLVIDDEAVRAEENQTILDVAREAGIPIPTLCHHNAVSPAGSCRMCIVQTHPKGHKRPFMTTACNFQVKEGMEVWTNSQKVLEARSSRAKFLLTKGPASKAIREIAAELGAEMPPLSSETDSTCILCSLCVRVCREAIGADALTLIPRKEGAEPHVEVSPNNCIGCGSCSRLCPTGFIKMTETGGQRIVWEKTFEMKKCARCGSYITTEAHWKYIEERTGVSSNFGSARGLCLVCRQDAICAELLELSEHFSTPLFTNDSH